MDKAKPSIEEAARMILGDLDDSATPLSMVFDGLADRYVGLSSGEQALVDLARDLWSNTGPVGLTHALGALDKTNRLRWWVAMAGWIEAVGGGNPFDQAVLPADSAHGRRAPLE